MAVGKRWLGTALAAAMLAAHARVLDAQDVPTRTAEQRVQQNHNELRDALLGPRSSAAQRDDAARRLAPRHLPATNAILQEALRSDNRDAKLSAAKALADELSPDPLFIAALVQLLGPDRALTEAAANALARFHDRQESQRPLISYARDATKPATSREAVIRAMGSLVSPAVAEALVELMADPKQAVLLRNAAADALSELTGLPYGRDPARWRQWQANAPKNDLAWRAEVEAGHSARLELAARKEQAFAAEMWSILESQYQRQQATREEKDALMARFLGAAEPGMRMNGIELVRRAFSLAQYIPPVATERIPPLVGDGDSRVRLAAARAVKDLNLNALNPILSQLPQESDADVREAMAGALGRMKDPSAAPVLRGLLADPSLRVATAAANSLHDLADVLSQGNPAEARRTADLLWQTGQQRGSGPEGVVFRAACIDALAPLHELSHEMDLMQLANPQSGQPKELRSAAYRALAEMRDEERLATAIGLFLENEDTRAVDSRIDAIGALARAGRFEVNGRRLLELTRPNLEPNPKVQAAAWTTLQALLPKAQNLPMLKDFADLLRGDPQRQVVVLEALAQKLRQANQMEQWAYEEQNIGAAYVESRRPDVAVIHFRTALDALNKLPNPDQQSVRATVILVRQLLTALLDSKNYPEAAAFAAAQIRADRARQGDVGPIISRYAETLVDEGTRARDPQKLADARRLIDEALKMDPPLDERFLRNLRMMQEDAARGLSAAPGRSGP